MFGILNEDFTLFLYNRQYEDGTDPIFCAVGENPGTVSHVLNQMMFVLWTCGRNLTTDRELLLQAISLPNDLTVPPSPLPSFDTRPMMQIAAHIVSSVVQAHPLRIVPTPHRGYQLLSAPFRTMNDLTCAHVSLASNTDLTKLARYAHKVICGAQQYGCIFQPRHLIILGAAVDCADLHAHYLGRRIHDIPIAINEFSSHLKSLWTILTDENPPMQPQSDTSHLEHCILYGKLACDNFPDYFRTGNILMELPAIIKSMKRYLQVFCATRAFHDNSPHERRLYYTWINQIEELFHVVSSIRQNYAADDLNDIILAEALLVLTVHGTAGSSGF